jgi:hypothetical protein
MAMSLNRLLPHRIFAASLLLLATACIEEHPEFLGAAGETDGSGSTMGTTAGSDDTNEGGAATGMGDTDASTSTTDPDDHTGEAGDTGEPECTQDVCGTLPGCECCDPNDSVGGEPCYSDDWDLVGTGVCEAGVTTCQDGVWVCDGEVLPSEEQCNGQDDDCDGEIDTGCDCIDGEQRSCYSGPEGSEGVGICQAGQQTCEQGAWGSCMGETTPETETCNGQDDNCDGQVDGGFGQVTCGLGICQVTVQTCIDGEPNECVPGEPEPEELCNGIDDTCDGQVDTGCDCVDGEQQSCYTGPQGTVGIGICEAGLQTCEQGAWSGCVGDTTPTSETCNGLDDDCNGFVDDGNPGGGALCDTQLFGVCKFGQMQCIGGSLQCVQTVFPEEEVCDGKDNDCNGFVDDGDFGGDACDTGLPGVCADGSMQCEGGSMQCVQNTQPQNEICGDGLDNNCNGLIDDGCPCAHSKCFTGGALVEGCDDCVYQICQAMPSCCNDSWSSACVNAVQTICKCANCSWGCAHNLCATGGALTKGCDPGCVTQVCDVDPYCCSTGWDSVCLARATGGGNFGGPIGYVAPVCNLSCSC